MQMNRVDCYDSTGRLRVIPDAWFVYLFFCVSSHPAGLVKIGVSKTPLFRLADIQTNSAFPMQSGMYVVAGTESCAKRIESEAKKAWAHRNTRGEWFTFTFGDPFVREETESIINAVYYRHVGRPLRWSRVSPEQVQACVALRCRNSFEAQARRRKKGRGQPS